jgi:hypothetical protein
MSVLHRMRKWNVAFLVLLMLGSSQSSLRSQQSGSAPLYMRLGLSLEAPSYGSGEEVAQHATFSAVFANALTDAFKRSPSELCAIGVSVDFPDLVIHVTLPRGGAVSTASAKNILKDCVRAAEPKWLDRHIDEERFVDAAKQTEQERHKLSLWDAVAKLPRERVYRLGIVGRESLRRLYKGDVVMSALLDAERTSNLSTGSYPAFSAWLRRQNLSGRVGIYDLDRSPIAPAKELSTVVTTPSPRPPLTWFAPDGERVLIHRADEQARFVILVRCAIGRDRMCAGSVSQTICGNDALRAALPSGVKLECGVLKVSGIAAWVLVELGEERWIDEIERLLASKMSEQGVSPEWSLVEQVASIVIR